MNRWAILPGLFALLAGCAAGNRRTLPLEAPAVAAAAAELAAYVRQGWHLPLRVNVAVSRETPEGGIPEPATPAEVALAERQIAAAREAQSQAAFDFFALDIVVGGVDEPELRARGGDRRLQVSLPAPGPDGGSVIEPRLLLEALGDAFEWDAVGPWYAAERAEDLVAALRRDLAKVDLLEEKLAQECGRLEYVVGALASRSVETGEPPMLTPSEAVFARGAQFRATLALHRLLNTVARWRAAALDGAFPLRREAQAVLLRARLAHEAYLDWMLDVVVGRRPVFSVWESGWWHRNPLYKVLDGSSPLDFVDLDGTPPGSIPAGSVRALLVLRYGIDLAACYGQVDALAGGLEAAALRGSPLEKEAAASLARIPATRAVREAHAFAPERAWKETWDARLKNGFQFPFYQVVVQVSTWLGDTRTSRRPPAVRGERAEALATRLRPGDILLVRQDDYLSNAFLPGFLPHAVLWLGDEADWSALRLEGGTELKDDPLVKQVLPRFRGARDEHGAPARAIEAVSEGVVFSSVAHVLAKDYVVALRPEVPEAKVAAAIRRALTLLGRPYDFDFDFATDSRIVCTELVYHAYNSDLNFRVQVDAPPPGPSPRVPGVLTVVGRKTMPANEIARYALRMQDQPGADPGTGYPGRRLSVIFFADRKDPGAVLYEGPAALAPLREAVER